MKKNISFDLSILALSVMTALILPFSSVIAGYCTPPLTSGVSAQVRADTLSAVSGADLPLHITIRNDSDSEFRGGEAIVTISRESKPGDFSRGNEFVVARAVVKSGLDIGPREVVESSFAWKVPATLPTGVYKIDSSFVHKDVLSEGKSAGMSAKVLISGETSGAVFFIAGTNENDEPSITLVNTTNAFLKLPVMIKTYAEGLAGKLAKTESQIVSVDKGSAVSVSYLASPKLEAYTVTAETTYRGVGAFYIFTKSGSAQCFDPKTLYPWAMLIGGLGVVMLVLVCNRKQKIPEQNIPMNN